MVTTEKCDDAWYEAVSTLVLIEQNGITAMHLTVEYESTSALDGALAGPMACVTDASYDRLDTYLPHNAKHLWRTASTLL